MSLRYFADHFISNYIIRMLEESGNIVLRLRDYIPKDSADNIVILKATELDCILISLNGDFADIVNYPPKKYKGIISLQVKDHPETIPQIMNRLKQFSTAHPKMSDYTGKLILVEPHRIRIR